MKNTYYVIFMLCLIANQIKPMIINRLPGTRDNYYSLDNMPEDILKEIVLTEADNFILTDLKTAENKLQNDKYFTIDDLKNAKYYQKCLDLPKNSGLRFIEFEKIVQERCDALRKYTIIVLRLSSLNKKLYTNLANLRAPLNQIPEQEAFLERKYIRNLGIILPQFEYDGEFYNASAYQKYGCLDGLIRKDKDNDLIQFYVNSTLEYAPEGLEKISLSHIAAKLNKEEKCLNDAICVLKKIDEEILLNTVPSKSTEKYIQVFKYCNTLTLQTSSRFHPVTINGQTMFFLDIILRGSLSHTNAKNEPAIPYLLVKTLCDIDIK